MQKHPSTVFSAEIWKELELLFRREELSCLPRYSSPDGLIPHEVETNKHGVEIHGTIWFLTGGSSNPEFTLTLLLSRPRFSSIGSVTAEELRDAIISNASLGNGHLHVTVY